MCELSNSNIFWLIADVVAIACAAFVSWRFERKLPGLCYKKAMLQLCELYLCGYSLYDMIRVNFHHRFGHYNHEGFCFTFSAANMLALKQEKTARLVRGHVCSSDFDSDHAWVEVKLCGRWCVIDPCLYTQGITYRRYFYRQFRPKVAVCYRHKQFWQDPAAKMFYQRMLSPKSSKIFVELFHYYTPDKREMGIYQMGEYLPELPNEHYYSIFDPRSGYKFCQRIVDELMVRPTRKSPRRRTLRRLDKCYREIARRTAQKSSA